MNLVTEIDKLLSTARKFWLAAKTDEEKAEYFSKINDLLDQRLELTQAENSN